MSNVATSPLTPFAQLFGEICLEQAEESAQNVAQEFALPGDSAPQETLSQETQDATNIIPPTST